MHIVYSIHFSVCMEFLLLVYEGCGSTTWKSMVIFFWCAPNDSKWLKPFWAKNKFLPPGEGATKLLKLASPPVVIPHLLVKFPWNQTYGLGVSHQTDRWMDGQMEKWKASNFQKGSQILDFPFGKASGQTSLGMSHLITRGARDFLKKNYLALKFQKEIIWPK